MIISKLQGGLGNQMFQYAVAYGLNDKVYLDLSFLRQNNKSSDTFTSRDFELQLFPNLKFTELDSALRDRLLPVGLFRRVLNKLIPNKISIIHQIENEFIEFPKQNNLYLDGYFQSEKYFINKRPQLLEVFKFAPLEDRNIEVQNKIKNTPDSVAIHIRRGDYLKPIVNQYHKVLPNEYYRQGIELINSKLNNPFYFIFSDDLDYAKATFGNDSNAIIIDGNQNSSWQDMALMSFCSHHIIANSSFSWWGAWLSQADNQINIAPRNWFNPEVAKFDINNIIPQNWIII